MAYQVYGRMLEYADENADDNPGRWAKCPPVKWGHFIAANYQVLVVKLIQLPI
jgi:hypothetical protein